MFVNGGSGVADDGVAARELSANAWADLGLRLVDVGDGELALIDTPGPPRWSQHDPDGVLADLLTSVCPAGPDREATDFEALERIGAWERIIAWAQARQIREIADLAARAEARPRLGMSPVEAVESATAEVGLMLHLAPRTAGRRVDEAQGLAARLPATLAALEGGRISLARARVIDEETAHLAEEQAAAVEAAVLERAATQTPGQLRAATRRAVLRTDPDAARERHARKRRDRHLRLDPDPDGMATFSAYLPAPEARGMYDTVDAHARRTGGSGDERSMDARRADALVDLVLSGCSPDLHRGPTNTGSNTSSDTGEENPSRDQQAAGTPNRPAESPVPQGWPEPPGAESAASRAASRAAAQVRVTVPLSALLGLDSEPGEMAGYGPIPAELARELAADGTWQRLLTDPATGALLDYGTTRYTPPTHLAQQVITRDQTCRFPGCRTPAYRCDLDHGEPFAPEAGTGPTSEGNISAKCRRHHGLKHRPGWSAVQHPDAALTWTTPSGHVYTTTPSPLAEPRQPRQQPPDSSGADPPF